MKPLGRQNHPVRFSFNFSDETKVIDLFLKLDADFDKKILSGSVTLTVERVQENATHLVTIIALLHMNFNA